MAEGQWEITSKSEMPGMPVEMPAETFRQCMSPGEPVPNQSDRDQQCRILESKQEGDTVTWTVECTQEGGTVKNSGSITYKGKSFEGTVNTDMSGIAGMGAMGASVMTTKLSGRHIGPCPE
jgi:hypothetical protein